MQSNYFTGIYTMQPHAGHAQIATLSTINSHAVLSIPNVSAITDLNLHTNTQSSNNTSTNSGNSINIHSSAAVQNHNHHTHHNHQQHSQTNDDSFDNVSSHACGVCGSTFRKSSGLKKHMKNHVIEQGRTLKVNNEAAEHPYKCNACKIQYPNSMSFEHHMEKEHAQPQALKCTQCGCFRPILLTSSSPFRCETCTHRNGDVFESSGLIKYQITSHIANPVSAQQIHVAHSKNLKLRLTDTNHTRRSRKQHQCPICEKSYKHQSTLAMHKKQHTGEYKYKCEYCYKEFYLTEYYTRHMRVHTREKPYTCDTCDKSFSQSNTLTQHKRIHTGEKPYLCTMCEKSFSVKDYLNKHIRTHTGEKPFECDLCGKKYTQRSGLKTHQKTHYPDLVVKSEETITLEHIQQTTQNNVHPAQTVSVQII